MFKTPKFWYRNQSDKPPIIEYIMKPFSLLYNFGHHLNLCSSKTRKAQIPVICVGNITAGGSGKTPTIIAINKLIAQNKMAKSPFFLSRGYGGDESKARRITVHDTAKKVGDEPLLLAKHSNIITSVNRYDGALMAQELGADCILMDDGFQNQSIFKDISVLVIDGKTGFGNGKILPSGPLREPISEAFSRAQAIIIIGDDKTNVTPLIPDNLPIFKASIRASNINEFDNLTQYIGFAGLAHPQKFATTLNDNKFNIVGFHEFADHHPYSNNDLDMLIIEAKDKGSKLITTEKDYQRIPEDYRKYIVYLSIELIWDNEKEITEFLKNSFTSFNNEQ